MIKKNAVGRSNINRQQRLNCTAYLLIRAGYEYHISYFDLDPQDEYCVGFIIIIRES